MRVRIAALIALAAMSACDPHRSNGAGEYLCSCPDYEDEVASVDWFGGGDTYHVDSYYLTRDAAPPAYVEVSAENVPDRSRRVDNLRTTLQDFGFDIDDRNSERFKATQNGMSVLVIGDTIDEDVMVIIVGGDPALGLPESLVQAIGTAP